VSEWRDLSPIGDEVQKELDRLRAAGDTTPPAAVVTELPHDGTESVPFNPDNEGFGDDIVVQIGDYAVKIHETSNFLMKFGVHIKPEVKSRSMLSAQETNGSLYAPDLEETQFNRLAGTLSQTHHNLYQKLVSIAEERAKLQDEVYLAIEKFGERSEQFEKAKAATTRSLEESNLQKYYFSKAYDALADIAKKLNLDVDLKPLCA